MHIKRIIFSLSLIATISHTAHGENGLLGSWSGVKEFAENNGTSLEAIAAFDSLANVSGGVEKDSALLGNFDLMLTTNTEKAGLWKNGTFFIYGLGNFGDSISELVGDTQVTSNIEAYGTFKLYEAWYKHNFSDTVSILLGLHDYNSEFYSLNHSAGLFNSSFGIGVDTAQVGPSIFSTTALATRLKLSPTATSYIQTAVYDGVPGSPTDPVGTQISYSSDDGLFYALEAGLNGDEDNYYKLGLGGWYHTTDIVNYSNKEYSSNYGGYFIAEKNITNQFGIFTQIGIADSSRNQISNYFGAGFSYIGIASSRSDDLLSFGVASARNNSKYSSLNDSNSVETALELNYRIQVSPWFAITPDVQYIINPGTQKTLNDAVVIGFRTEIVL